MSRSPLGEVPPRAAGRGRRLKAASAAACGFLPLQALVLLPLCQPPPEPPDADPDRTPAKLEWVRDSLRNGPGPVRIVVLGDSLAAGWGADEPETEAYYSVFAQALRARYPRCAIELIASGGPGDPSDVGLIRVEREVVSRRPDIVILQFGGNDERLGRKPADLTDDLTTLIRTVTGPRLNALCIVAAPPMNDPMPNTPFVRAAIFAAEGEGVPVANFDQALREADRDFRGPFSWGSHPNSYGHMIMGRELLRAWDALLGTESPLLVEIEGYSELLGPGDLPRLHVAVRNASDRPLDAELEYGPGLLAGREQLALQPGQQGDITQKITLPGFTRQTRTCRYRLWAVARSSAAETSDLDIKWLSIAPVIRPDVAETSIDPQRLTWHRLSTDSLAFGRHLWEGEEDLSARFALVWHRDRLLVEIQVMDDDLSPVDGDEHVSEGDSVEVCLDLRPSADQGKPVYSEDVVLLLVRPPRRKGGATHWSPLDGLTRRLIGVSASTRVRADGYDVTVAIPERALARAGEASLSGVGFDVHVNDSDFGLGRDCQMVWAGTTQNYLNPAQLGALVAPAEKLPVCRASLR